MPRCMDSQEEAPFAFEGKFMFEEAHPSEVVSEYPLLNDIWSSLKRLSDADFDKTKDVFLQGTAMHVTLPQNIYAEIIPAKKNCSCIKNNSENFETVTA